MFAGDQYIDTEIRGTKITGCDTYRSKKTTTLQKLAHKLGIDFPTIMIMNPQYADAVLRVKKGECIHVPKGSLLKGKSFPMLSSFFELPSNLVRTLDKREAL